MRLMMLGSLLFSAGCAGGVSQAVKSDLQKTVSSMRSPIELCYKEALDTNASLEGEVVLKFEVEEGKRQFSKVRVSKTTIDEPSFQQCLVQETSGLSLSQTPEAKLVVVYPLKFTKTEE